MKQFLLNLAVGVVLLNIFGALFLRGESYSHPIPKNVTVVVPFSPH